MGFFASLVFKMMSTKGNISSKSVFIYDKSLFPISRVMDLFLDKWIGKNLEVVAVKI